MFSNLTSSVVHLCWESITAVDVHWVELFPLLKLLNGYMDVPQNQYEDMLWFSPLFFFFECMATIGFHCIGTGWDSFPVMWIRKCHQPGE